MHRSGGTTHQEFAAFIVIGLVSLLLPSLRSFWQEEGAYIIHSLLAMTLKQMALLRGLLDSSKLSQQGAYPLHPLTHHTGLML